MVWQPRHIRQASPRLTTSCYPFCLSSSPVRGSQTLLRAIPGHLTFPYRFPPGFTVSDPPRPQEQTWAQVTRKGGKGKQNATAAQVAASIKSSVPKGPPPLPAAQRRFFAPRTSPALPTDWFIMTTTLPDIMAAVLKEANCSLPLSLTASVNCNGAVTLTANPYTLSSAYSPFFDSMTKKRTTSVVVAVDALHVSRFGESI